MAQWASVLGRRVLQQLSQLYRALVWEAFILLAVAADEEKSSSHSGSQSDSQTSTSHFSVPAPSASVGSETTSSSTQASATHSVSSGIVSISQSLSSAGSSVPSESMDTSSHSSTVTIVTAPCAQTASSSSSSSNDPSDIVFPKLKTQQQQQQQQQPTMLAESLKQLTPLLSITSRVGRSLAELMSLLIRNSTSPLHRHHRRGPGHHLPMHSYHQPSEDAISVCLEVTDLLVDSLKWEVPTPKACLSAMHSPISEWLFAG